MTVKFAETTPHDNGDGTISGTGTIGTAQTRASYTRDAMGRITEYREWDNWNTLARDRYSITYDNDSNVGHEIVSQRKVTGSGVGTVHTYLSETTNSYDTYTKLLTSSATIESLDGSDSAAPDTSTTYAYSWMGGAVVHTTTVDSNTGSTADALLVSTYYYDTMGRVESVDIDDGRRHSVSFAYTPEGQVLNRKERSVASTNPEDQHYFITGRQVGDITNNGYYDPYTADEAENILKMRNWDGNPAAAPFRWNTTSALPSGNFSIASGYQAINPNNDGSATADNSYTVHGGETLQSIASAIWGDSSLWYVLASANGLSGGETLVAGQTLVLPDRVNNIHNSANTFKVYDPNRALGDLSPTTPKPGKAGGTCAVVGQILVIAIAIAITAILKVPVMGMISGMLGGASTGAAVVGAALTGAIASTVSQGVGVAIGVQDKISWKGVALSALSAGITQGIGGGSLIRGAGSFINNAARGALVSVATQGIGIATGLQNKFDWAGVAGAALGGGLSGTIGAHVSGFGGQVLSNTASGIANATARTLIDGGDFGDNLIASLPDVIGSTIGNWLGGVAQGSGSRGTIQAVSAADLDPLPDPSSTDSGEIVVAGNRHLSDQEISFRRAVADVAGAIRNSLPAPTDAATPAMCIYQDGNATLGLDHPVPCATATGPSVGFIGPNLEYGEWARGVTDPSTGIEREVFHQLEIPNTLVADLGLAADPMQDGVVSSLTPRMATDFSGFERSLIAPNRFAGLDLYPTDGGRDPLYLPTPTTISSYDPLPQMRLQEEAERYDMMSSPGLSGLLSGAASYSGADIGRTRYFYGVGNIFDQLSVGGAFTPSPPVVLGSPAAESEVLSPFTQRYLTESGGRFGNTATRAQNYDLARSLQDDEFDIVGGGGIRSEEYIKGVGPGTMGGTFVDITGSAADGRTVRIQTIDTLPDRLTPTVRETDAAARIRAAFPHDELRLIPKGR